MKYNKTILFQPIVFAEAFEWCFQFLPKTGQYKGTKQLEIIKSV